MPVVATPIFPQAPRQGVAVISTANTNRDGSGTIETVFLAGANGSYIERIDICAAGTTTDGLVGLYLHNGSIAVLWREARIPAITPSASVPAFMRSTREWLFLPAGCSLRASTHKAEGFNVNAWGGDL